jgi:hypothetical protein
MQPFAAGVKGPPRETQCVCVGSHCRQILPTWEESVEVEVVLDSGPSSADTSGTAAGYVPVGNRRPCALLTAFGCTR